MTGTPEIIRLWPDRAPGARGDADADIPKLRVFVPDSPNGAAMVICPGGGYEILSSYEGDDYALWLNQSGITCFVLNYRLGTHGYRHPFMLHDVARAVRVVRTLVGQYDLDTQRIGIMGSSAGGHLAATLLTRFDSGNSVSSDPIERQSSRPNLGILCYPVITMGEFGHSGSRENLLGAHCGPSEIAELSTELHVRSDTPPSFIWATVEDPAVPVENALMFATALRQKRIPFALHLFEKGGHGLGLGDQFPFANCHPWTKECLHWLHEHGFVGQPPKCLSDPKCD